MSHSLFYDLFTSKCLPVLLYGLEACPLTKSMLSSLDFVINRFFMKLFKTTDMSVVKYCQHEFNFDIPSDIIVLRNSKFVVKYRLCDNVFSKYS